MNTEILLIRHATPDWSRTDLRYDIPPGPPLTEKGRTEASLAADYLRDAAHLAHLLVSPLDRTKQTAQVIADQLQVPFTIDETVAEWQRGESEEVVQERMSTKVESMVAVLDSRCIGLVTHGGPIRMLLHYFGVGKAEIDFYCKQFDRNNPVPPAGIWRAVRAGGDSLWAVELVFTPEPHRKFEPAATTVHV